MKRKHDDTTRADENNGRWGTGIYMYDCIHLRACRRQRLIYGKRDHPMHCNVDCSAYISGNEREKYVTLREAVEYARDGVQLIRSGYDAYDVYCECDLDGKTLNDIIKDL